MVLATVQDKEHSESYHEAPSLAAGRVDSHEVTVQHPLHSHVRSQKKPSMKQGRNHIKTLIGRDGKFVSVIAATCTCATRLVRELVKKIKSRQVLALLQTLRGH